MPEVEHERDVERPERRVRSNLGAAFRNSTESRLTSCTMSTSPRIIAAQALSASRRSRCEHPERR